jgi:hypothetical protein
LDTRQNGIPWRAIVPSNNSWLAFVVPYADVFSFLVAYGEVAIGFVVGGCIARPGVPGVRSVPESQHRAGDCDTGWRRPNRDQSLLHRHKNGVCVIRRGTCFRSWLALKRTFPRAELAVLIRSCADHTWLRFRASGTAVPVSGRPVIEWDTCDSLVEVIKKSF